MSAPTELANLIERSVTGPMWHGSALNEILDGVTFEQANARPIAGAHTVWELVLHITAWADIACDRLHGKSLGTQPNEVDWPPMPAPTEIAWTQARARLTASHGTLARETAKLTSEQLRAMVPVEGPQYSAWTLLHGVVEHDTYHGGQIALLKRALNTSTT